MRNAAAVIVASLAWTAWGVAAPFEPLLPETGNSVTLKPGESAQAAAGSLRVGFEGVTADSRCPKGEQCIRAGDATVRIWLQSGSGPRETREVHTASGAAQTASASGWDVRLRRLDPYPITGQSVARQDYVATLTLSSGGANAPADR